LGAAILVSTILHHGFPEVLHVPRIFGALSTLGPPLIAVEIAFDCTVVFTAWFALYHCLRKNGWFRGSQLFIGAFIFAGLEENVWILAGRFGANGSYYFTDGGLWFGEIPVYTCIGWFVLMYSCYAMLKDLFPKARTGIIAPATGFLAMMVDVWIDPVLVHIGLWNSALPAAGLWVWTNPHQLKLVSIPLMNFLGWWLVVTFYIWHYGLMFESSGREERSPGKRTFVFYLTFPIYWAIIVTILGLVEITFRGWWGGAGRDLFPVPFN
jgi:uncharacterized membrane protein